MKIPENKGKLENTSLSSFDSTQKMQMGKRYLIYNVGQYTPESVQ